MINESVFCVTDPDVSVAPNTSLPINTLPDVNTANQIVNAPCSAIKDLQLDLASFIFGLSELRMRVVRQSELDVRISLLQNCLEDTKSKIDKFIK